MELRNHSVDVPDARNWIQHLPSDLRAALESASVGPIQKLPHLLFCMFHRQGVEVDICFLFMV